MLRFLDAGESHGKALTAIIEGIPSNCKVNISYINNELNRRQKGYGRGSRMTIEEDKVNIWSGVRKNMTTGNPITMIIFNKDYENWISILEDDNESNNPITVPRPGHGDLVGYIKYNTGDIRNVIERTSARETAIRTAVGALCKSILEKLNIIIRSKTNSIGDIYDKSIDIFHNENYKIIEESDVRCYNNEIGEAARKVIDNCKEKGETIGGSILVSVKGIPAGIGSYIQWDRKLDGILSQAVMSVQGIKAVEFGSGMNMRLKGSEFNDEIQYRYGCIQRSTNNAGGIEAGVSNGEDIVIRAFMKPIPTVRLPINTIDLSTRENMKSRYERSDVCAVIPAAVVLENVCAFHVLKEILNKFSSDDFNELKRSLQSYRNDIEKF